MWTVGVTAGIFRMQGGMEGVGQSWLVGWILLRMFLRLVELYKTMKQRIKGLPSGQINIKFF